MKHWYNKPDSHLTGLVRTILIMEGFSEATPDSLPIFTNGMPTLLCRTERNAEGFETISQLTLLGNSTSADSWMMNDQTTIIAYFFHPFSMAGLFNIPTRKLSESRIDLCNWSPHIYNAIRTQLIYADTTSRKVEVLDHLLIQLLSENREACEIIRYATDQIMRNSGKEVLSEILENLNLNERTFQRVFKKYVGVTPTQYRRICQFQLSFGQLRSKKFNKISDVAFDNGFSDQSHFIRSFKEFTRLTPNDYLKKGLGQDS